MSGAADPAADGLVTDTLKRIGRDGRDRGRGQVAGIGWAAAEAAASIAANGGDSVAGLRDAAPYSGSCPTGCCASPKRRRSGWSDVEATADGGTVTIRASKTDQQGDGAVRFLGAPTVAAVQRYLEAAGITDGPLFRRIRKGGRVTDTGLGADSIRAIVRKRAAAVDGITGRIGGHSLRVGSARELAADGASLVELQQAGGWRSPTTPAVYVQARVSHPRPGRSPAVRGRSVGGAASARGGHRVSVPERWILPQSSVPTFSTSRASRPENVSEEPIGRYLPQIGSLAVPLTPFSVTVKNPVELIVPVNAVTSVVTPSNVSEPCTVTSAPDCTAVSRALPSNSVPRDGNRSTTGPV